MAGPADEKPQAPTTPPSKRTPAGGSNGRKVLIGTMISERYRIERLLGEGGMGAVYQAEHTLMRKRMAIKVLHPEMTRLPEVVARFEREAMAAAHIDHPHVVTATDFGKLEDGSFFLALEFVEGKSLRDIIARGRLELGRALHIGRQIALALSRAHALKIVHRDLKPENVMLVERDGDPNFVKVLDFGIAKVQMGELSSRGSDGAAHPAQPVLTQAGMVYGTPEYMAPEQALGQPVDARADLYALGCIMYEMLTGSRPFEADSKVALLGMQVTAPVPAMAFKAPDANIPPEVEALVRRLLAKEASERLGDARELIDGIAAVMGALALAGAIDPAFTPAPPTRYGSNPILMSGMGSVPDLAAAGSRPSLVQAPKTEGKLEGLLAGKAWLLPAVLGVAGILVLTLVTFFVVKGREPADRTDGGTTGGETGIVASTPAEQKIKEAIAQIDKGNYGSGIEALETIPEAKGREDVHRALFKAYSQTNRAKEAMLEIGLLLKANPSVDLVTPESISLRQEVRNTALLEGQPTASKVAVDEAWSLLAGRLGPVGFDDLYEIAYGPSGTAPGYKKARDRAQREMAKGDRSKMSPALAVTLELQSPSLGCPNVKAAVERAAERGDERTLVVMRSLASPRLVGGWKKTDVLACIHEGTLTKAIGDLETRLRKK